MKEEDQGRFSPPSTSPSSSKDRVDQGRFSPPPLPASTATSIHEGKDDQGPPLLPPPPPKTPAPPPPSPPKAPPPPSPPVSPRVTRSAKRNKRSTPRMTTVPWVPRSNTSPLLSQAALQCVTYPLAYPQASSYPAEHKYFVGYYNADSMGIVAPPVAINLRPLAYTRNAIPAEEVFPPHQVRAVSKDCWEKVAVLQHVRSFLRIQSFIITNKLIDMGRCGQQSRVLS